MSETPSGVEKSETIPTIENVEKIFDQLFGKVGETTLFKEDIEGVYLWDIRIDGKDGYVEYSYMRNGKCKEGSSKNTTIYVAYYNEDGSLTGGEYIAEFIDGEWVLTDSGDYINKAYAKIHS